MTRFEIVRTDALQPWHARIRAGNSKKWWSTEQYPRRASALKAAVNLMLDLVEPDTYELRPAGLLLTVNGQNREIGITDVDERTP